MPRWTGIRVWQKHSGRLAVAEEDEFERRALRLLQAIWPTLQQTPRKKGWDAKGIDLIVWSDEGAFPCAIQCKGFKVQNLGPDQIRQVDESIDKFAASDVNTNLYLLIHNREGRFPEFNDHVTEKLNRLVASGRVPRAELWDRQTLMDRVFDAVVGILERRLRQHSDELQRQFQQLMRFGHLHIRLIPVTEKLLRFKRGEPCSEELVHPVRSFPLHEVLLEPSNYRWTLLVGRFGTGKTTAVLKAASESRRSTLFVPCSAIPASAPPQSTSALLEEATKSLGLLEEFEPDTRGVLDEVAGAVLAYLLRRPETPYTLVLDGLDENRIYSTLPGLQQLSNQLSDLRCPIVLTTRTEHLHATLGNFTAAFTEFSTKNNPSRAARLFELALWDPSQILALVTAILEEQQLSESERERVRDLHAALESGRYGQLYGELPHHPLFLQFIIDDVSAEGLRSSDRSRLLRSWVARKIRRDRMTWAPGSQMTRPAIDESLDVEEFVARMIALLENIAFSMVEWTRDHWELVEFVGADVVRREAASLFPMSTSDPLLGILLNSVLTSREGRRGLDFDVGFILRVLQEYFLAAYLARERVSISGYPESVKSFYAEIMGNSVAPASV